MRPAGRRALVQRVQAHYGPLDRCSLKIEAWRQDYNQARSHIALSYRPRSGFRRFFDESTVERQELSGLLGYVDQTMEDDPWNDLSTLHHMRRKKVQGSGSIPPSPAIN